MLTLDELATRYHLLPSQVIETGSTFDLQVLNLAAKWAKHQHDKAHGITESKEIPKLTEEQMLSMAKYAKGTLVK